ncbi:DUF6765 family protein [Megalodesulfovibrio paquesii]
MQIDMHYYGMYALAFAAGLREDVASIIATSSQLVDDFAYSMPVSFRDAGQFTGIATAHHTASIRNIDRDDQREVWVPFHFIPGNNGSDFTERLVCQRNSPIAREMFERAISEKNAPYWLHRIGIATHVFADTFAHYGFSGVSSRRNQVDNTSIRLHNLDGQIRQYILNKAMAFFKNEGTTLIDNIKSTAAECISGALGHGGVATYPDRPYLVWEFDYEDGRASGRRDNPQTYMEACEHIFEFFKKVLAADASFARTAHASPEFRDIEASINSIIRYQGNKESRISQWTDKARKGEITGSSFNIPEYPGEKWLEQLESLQEGKDSSALFDVPGYLFALAAHDHLNFVVRRLLPTYRISIA